MNIVKRNGEEVPFERSKIESAIRKANGSVDRQERIDERGIRAIAGQISEFAEDAGRPLSVEDVQDRVEMALMERGHLRLAKNYITYRYQHEIARRKNTTDDEVMSLLDGRNEEAIDENANKDPREVSVQRDYMAGLVSEDLCRRYLYPKDVMAAHDDGRIYIHDLDYVAMHEHNCELINLEDMLQNGTVMHGFKIERPKSLLTACTVATQISAAVCSATFGGQTISLAHLSPFVDVSRRKIRAQLEEDLGPVEMSAEQMDGIVERRLRQEISASCQTLMYQWATITCSNGQAPFISVMMCLGEAEEGPARKDLAMMIEEMLRQRIRGVKDESGEMVNPTFPKLLYVLDDYNVSEGAPFFYLTELAAECTAKRMVPDYISAKVMRQLKVDRNGDGQVYPCMGCRAFLTPYLDGNGRPKYYGRFNAGACTVNLPYTALLALETARREKELGLPFSADPVDVFFEELDRTAELCHRAQLVRLERLAGTRASVAPILWQHGAIARLGKDETIDRLMYGGYMTISLGYIGLWETVLALTGKTLADPDGEAFGRRVLERLNSYTAKWKAESNIDWSLYGTPAEGCTYACAKAVQKRFGIVKGISDKLYLTNSYHIDPSYQIDAFSKLTIESRLQRLSPGGSISYVEAPDLTGNLGSVLALIRHIYDHNIYAEINVRSFDSCRKCGFHGEVELVQDKYGKYSWKCPSCGNVDTSTMNIVRRVCGYLGNVNTGMNQGRLDDIASRVLHLD